MDRGPRRGRTPEQAWPPPPSRRGRSRRSGAPSLAGRCGRRPTSTRSPVATRSVRVAVIPAPRTSRTNRAPLLPPPPNSAPLPPASGSRRAQFSSAWSPAAKSGSPTTADRRGRAGARLAQQHARLDGAVEAVDLEADGGVDRLGRQRRPLAEADAARDRAAGVQAEADVALLLPQRPRVGQQRGRDEQRDGRVGLPERLELRELLRETQGERVAGDDGVQALRLHEVLRPQHLGGVGAERLAERLDAVARDGAARGGAVAAVARAGGGGRPPGPPAGRRRGWSGRSPCPRPRRAR